MGKWVSGAEAARHLNISESAVRKRAATGKIERQQQPNGSYLYWLDDDELDEAVAVESAMEASGIDVLARVIEETARNQQDALEAIKQAYDGQIAAQEELARELRNRAERAEERLAETERELRELRNQERTRGQAVEEYLRELREAMRERAERRWWRFWS